MLLLLRYVFGALSQLSTRASSRGLIQREQHIANVYIIGLLDADFLTCKIVSLANQFDSLHYPASLILYLYAPVLYLITQDLVNKPCGLESTYL